MFLNAHVFIDGDNIPSEQIPQIYEKLFGKYNIKKYDIFANHGYSNRIKRFESSMIKLKRTPFSGKNSTDILIAMSIADAIAHEKELDAIIIVSSDRDFIIPIEYALNHGKKVISIYQQEAIAKALLEIYNNPNLSLYCLEDLDTEIKCVLPKWINEKISTLEDISTYFKVNYKGESVLIPHGDEKRRVPFIQGISQQMFRELMKKFGLNVTGKKKFDKALKAAELFVKDGYVWKNDPFKVVRLAKSRWGQKRYRLRNK